MRYELDGKIFLAMLRSAQANLANHQKDINALNVFPVPDGDTGTNMSMTLTNGLKEAESANTYNLSEIASALSKGLLMGARGNSGVITSQIFRGFSQAIVGKESLRVQEIASAFENGALVAYKAIMKPVEGTILTVIRSGSKLVKNYVLANPSISVEEYFTKLVEFSKSALASTPDLLPILKEVGVVDSGGAGLCLIFEGLLAGLEDRPIILEEKNNDSDYDQHIAALDLANDEFGYCTEFIIRLHSEWSLNFDEEVLKNKLIKNDGSSLVYAKDNDLVKIHVHTLHPGTALNIAQYYGDFIKIKVENMQEQHRQIEEETKAKKENKKKQHQKYGLIAVAAGEGLHKLFNDCRIDVVINGGQTMNPSTADFSKEIESLDADHIFLFPNNGNIILAATQAKELHPEKDIIVIPSKTIPEGLAALSLFNPLASKEDNINDMQEAIANVLSASLTYAIKDTSLNGVTVKAGDFIGMSDKQIVASGCDKLKVMFKLLDTILQKEDASLLTLIAGSDASKDEIKTIVSYIENNSNCEVEVVEGKQPVYSYLLGVE